MSESQQIINVGNVDVANHLPFVLFGGMNVLESRDLAMRIAEHYVEVTQKLNIPSAASQNYSPQSHSKYIFYTFTMSKVDYCNCSSSFSAYISRFYFSI